MTKLENKMNKEQEHRVLCIIEEQLGLSRGEATPEKTLQGNLGMDSLDGIELIMEIEDYFEISIPDEAAEKVVTVQDAINLVAEMVA